MGSTMKKISSDWKMTMTEADKEIERVIKEVKYERQMKRKRMYDAAIRARRKEASGTPMAERADLKSVQCEFESRAEDE